MSSLKTYATFITNEAHHDLFRNGNLVEEWSCMYPMLFDSDDVRIAHNQRHLGFHYHEWLAAILLYHTTGLLSLIEAYAYKIHTRKRQILETLVNDDAFDLITSAGISSVTQCPDLLVYHPVTKDWFFCEVKGPNDHLRESQLDFFKKLEDVTGKEIKVIYFQNDIVPS